MPRRVIGGLILSMALAAGAPSGGASVAASFLSADAPPVAVPRRIPWSEISEVQVGHTMTGRGALIGTLCSAFICTTMLLLALDRPRSSELPALGLVTAAIVVGPIVGAAIGRSHGHWRTVYPPPNPSSRSLTSHRSS
jgi:hypothetical protein